MVKWLDLRKKAIHQRVPDVVIMPTIKGAAMADTSDTASSTKRPRKKRPSIWLVLAGILVAAGVAYAFVQRPWEEKPRAVAAESIALGPVSQVLAVNGRVVPANQVTVRSPVSAQALEVAVSEGDAVNFDQVLLRLDPARAQAQVDQAEAALNAGIIRQQQAKANADRANALGDNAPRSTREDAVLSLTEAESEVNRLRAALQQSQADLRQYVITAPLAGVVMSRSVDRGQLVDPQSELFVVADISQLQVETEVDELYSSRIEKGLKVLLKPVGETVARHGSVVFAAPRVDTSTGGRVVKIGFDEEADLPVGLTINANIVVAEYDEALSIPRKAIVTEGAQSHVFVVENGEVKQREITFSDWPADRVIVTEGLAVGDAVVLDPSAVKTGQRVAVE
jgi:membrane fusion protein (multidrug efflux system)